MTSKFVIGLAVIAVLIAVVFYKQRGDHLEPTGSILKLRSVPADEQRSLVVLDLRIHNDADVAMNVRDVSLSMELNDGREVQGTLVSGKDSKDLFGYYPALGEMYNQPLIPNTKVAAHQTADFMLAGRLDVSEQQLADRKKLAVVVQDRGLSKVTLSEKRR